MAVLSWMPAGLLGALALGGCYSPELRDCAVSCTGDADCAPGQSCGSDGMCASPSLVGTCKQGSAPTDDATMPTDATRVADAAIDAAIVIDAPPPDPRVQLTLQIAGRGRIDVVGTSLTCSDAAPNHTCTFDVLPGVPRTLHAVAGQDSRFEKWQSMTCAMQDETCMFTSSAPVTVVEAKFKNDNNDD